MKTMTITSENLGEIISRTFNKDFWREADRDQFLYNVRLLIAELDGGRTDLYDEACEEAKKILTNKEN